MMVFVRVHVYVCASVHVCVSHALSQVFSLVGSLDAVVYTLVTLVTIMSLGGFLLFYQVLSIKVMLHTVNLTVLFILHYIVIILMSRLCIGMKIPLVSYYWNSCQR